MHGGWVSGGCFGGPFGHDNLPLRLLHMECRVVVAQLEELAANLARHRERLPVLPLEYAALMEGTESVTKEAGWIVGMLAKLAEQEERRQSGNPSPGGSSPMP